jgi:hypothetical protein
MCWECVGCAQIEGQLGITPTAGIPSARGHSAKCSMAVDGLERSGRAELKEVEKNSRA